jgi:hypothetical protein
MNHHSIWKGFQWVAEVGKIGFRWQVGNGKQVRFWEDNWLGHYALGGLCDRE